MIGLSLLPLFSDLTEPRHAQKETFELATNR